eukprot:scaffold265311_cov33-Tisochrysis_lutea.AAC.3
MEPAGASLIVDSQPSRSREPAPVRYGYLRTCVRDDWATAAGRTQQEHDLLGIGAVRSDSHRPNGLEDGNVVGPRRIGHVAESSLRQEASIEFGGNAAGASTRERLCGSDASLLEGCAVLTVGKGKRLGEEFWDASDAGVPAQSKGSDRQGVCGQEWFACAAIPHVTGRKEKKITGTPGMYPPAEGLAQGKRRVRYVQNSHATPCRARDGDETHSLLALRSISRFSAVRTEGSTHGEPAPSRYAPITRFTFLSDGSFLKACAMPRILSGAPCGTCG